MLLFDIPLATWRAVGSQGVLNTTVHPSVTIVTMTCTCSSITMATITALTDILITPFIGWIKVEKGNYSSVIRPCRSIESCIRVLWVSLNSFPTKICINLNNECVNNLLWITNVCIYSLSWVSCRKCWRKWSFVDLLHEMYKKWTFELWLRENIFMN